MRSVASLLVLLLVGCPGEEPASGAKAAPVASPKPSPPKPSPLEPSPPKPARTVEPIAKPGPDPRALLARGPGTKGSFPPGTRFLQLEVSRTGVRLLGGLINKPGLRFALPRRGNHLAVIVDAEGREVRVPFDVRGLAPLGARLEADGERVVGDVAWRAAVPVMLRLPALTWPATLTVVRENGALVGVVQVGD